MIAEASTRRVWYATAGPQISSNSENPVTSGTVIVLVDAPLPANSPSFVHFKLLSILLIELVIQLLVLDKNTLKMDGWLTIGR